RIRDGQDLQPVRQPPLGDAFDRIALLRRGSVFLRRLRPRREGGQAEHDEKEPDQISHAKRWSASSPAMIVAKVMRQRHATAIATAPASNCSFPTAISGAQIAVSTAAGT